MYQQYPEQSYYAAATQAYGAQAGRGVQGGVQAAIKRSHSPDTQGKFKQGKTEGFDHSTYYSAAESGYGNNYGGGYTEQQGWTQSSGGGEMIDFSEDSFPSKGSNGSQAGAANNNKKRGGVQRGNNRGFVKRGVARGRGMMSMTQGSWGAGMGDGFQGQGYAGQGQRGMFKRGGMMMPDRGRGRGRGINPGFIPQTFNPMAKRGKRGGQAGGKVAPVQSMSKVVQVDPSQMTTAEKIRRFCLFLQNDTVKGNSIQTIENGLMSSKLGMKTEFVAEELTRVSGKCMYTGRLSIDGVFLVRGIGSQKKEMKHEIFQKAYEILLSKTVAEIFNLVDPGVEAIRKELESSLENKKADRVAIQEALHMATERMVICSDLREALTSIIKVLREPFKGLENPISKVEQAVSRSHCGIKQEFKCEEVRMKSGKPMFYGKLLFLDVVVAHGKDSKKKACKAKTYQTAIDALLTKPVEDLLVSVPEEPREEELELEEKGVKLKLKDLSLEERFDSLIKHLTSSAYRDNNVSTIDLAAMHRGITTMAVYRQQGSASSGMTCELYMEDYLIATGSGQKRKDSMQDAYSKAYDVLCSTSASEILSQHKILKAEEKLDPSILDIFVKGCGHSQESNMAGLKRYNNHEKIGTVAPEDVVIMEQSSWSEDRIKHAFCILQHSATQNAMLLQWQMENYNNTSEYMCTVFLQNKQVGQCVAPSKHIARNSACVDALFRLYETQDVISITKRDDSKGWIQWNDVFEKAGVDPTSNGIIKVETIVSETLAKPTSDEEAGTIVKEEIKKESEIPDPKLMKVLEEHIMRFLGAKNEPEMAFGPGMPHLIQKELRALARGHNVRLDVRQYNAESYCLLHSPMSPQEIMGKVKENGGKFGRYELVSKEALPKHNPSMLNLRYPVVNKPTDNKPADTTVSESMDQSMPPVSVKIDGF